MSITRNRVTSEPDIGSMMNGFIADSYVLLLKTQSCHWDPRAHGADKLTGTEYTKLFATIDLLAERSCALQLTAPTSLGGMLHLATLDQASEIPITKEAAGILAKEHARMAARARELAHEADEADDAPTHDLLVARILAHEKVAWRLNGHAPDFTQHGEPR